MTTDVREKVRRLRGKLCSLAEEYKGVSPQVCQRCESPCVPGREMLKALGMERKKSVMITDVFEPVHHSRDRITRKLIHGMNKRGK